MYIIKNALKCIGRSKGRNILIGVIVLVIAVSACLGLSIRQAAESAKEETMASLSVTATISFDRTSAMQDIQNQMPKPDSENGGGFPQGGFDKNQFADMMQGSSSLTLEEYKKYAEAESVKDFYYTMTVSMNGSEEFEPVSNTANDDSEEETEEEDSGSGFDMPGGFGGGFGGFRDQMFGAQSDFSVVGYSNEAAMTSFVNGTAKITDGAVFGEETENYDCIISDELATYNSIAVGDSFTLTNPNSEEETYVFTVVGTYTDSSANESSFSMMGATSTDPANKIYMSYAALNKILGESEAVSETQTNEFGMEFETKITGTLSGTYVFEDTDGYYKFEEEVRALGLEETYTVSSSDIANFENSLVPLNTLSKMAGYFLIVILLIGAIILVVLNIFNVRERKYEIGVFTAMGMKKSKVSLQFLTEIFAVTMVAVIIGAFIGGFFSVPVTNALLENQVASQQSNEAEKEMNFGRGEGFEGMMPGGDRGGPGNRGGKGNMFANIFGGKSETNYVSEISSAMNFTVVLQMLGIAVLLTLAAGTVSMMFVMRYEPLKILANRD